MANKIKTRERILIEFPISLLHRTDQAALASTVSRSELIRQAVEHHLEAIEREAFELELAAAYKANSEMNRALADEFGFVDSEGL